MDTQSIMGFVVGVTLETFLLSVLAILFVAKNIIDQYKDKK